MGGDGGATGHDVAADRPGRRTSWRRAAVSGFLVLAMVTAFAYALSGKWDQIVSDVRDQQLAVVLAALGCALTGVWMSFELWRGTLAVLGTRITRRAGAPLFFLTQLGKYLPGSVWPVVAQMRLGRAIGIPRQRTALAFLLTLGLSVVVGLLVGLSAFQTLLRAESDTLLWALLVVPALLSLLVPAVVNALLGRALRVLRRPPLQDPLTSGDLARGVVWTVMFWVVFGAHVWVLAIGLGADPLTSFPVAVGGFALAFSIGPLLVVLPAGAGVREAVLVVLLSAVLTTPEATAVALTSRGLLLLTDGLLALVTSTGALARRRAGRADVPVGHS